MPTGRLSDLCGIALPCVSDLTFLWRRGGITLLSTLGRDVPVSFEGWTRNRSWLGSVAYSDQLSFEEALLGRVVGDSIPVLRVRRKELVRALERSVEVAASMKAPHVEAPLLSIFHVNPFLYFHLEGAVRTAKEHVCWSTELELSEVISLGLFGRHVVHLNQWSAPARSYAHYR